MFHKAIVELQKVRKFCDHRTIDLQENSWLSAIVEDASMCITTAIRNLVQADKVLRNKPEEPKELKLKEITNA